MVEWCRGVGVPRVERKRLKCAWAIFAASALFCEGAVAGGGCGWRVQEEGMECMDLQMLAAERTAITLQSNFLCAMKSFLTTSEDESP